MSCFFGYRIFLAILTLLGFLAGGPVGCLLSLIWQPEGDLPAPVWMLFVGLACAFIGAYLAQHLYRVGIFMLGAVAGAATGALLAAVTEQTPEGWWIWLCAILGGLAALLAQTVVIVLATAFSGAVHIALSVTYFKGALGFYGLFGLSGVYYALGESLSLVLGLTIAGAAVQFGLTARGAPTPREQYLAAQSGPRSSASSDPGAAPRRTAPGSSSATSTASRQLRKVPVPASNRPADNTASLQRGTTPGGAREPSTGVASAAWLQQVEHETASPASGPGVVRFASLEEEWDSIPPEPPLAFHPGETAQEVQA
ncbi:MAG: DUF4203 domain-containing protein [Armatimonadetes bacterium]|nr:DUF4203 domain-containing protein [Armatimonadota bacterium]